jgi:hypothetical protein
MKYVSSMSSLKVTILDDKMGEMITGHKEKAYINLFMYYAFKLLVLSHMCQRWGKGTKPSCIWKV